MPADDVNAAVLGADGGRRRLLARLGHEALEPIEAFLGQTLAYESGHPASLQNFIHWIGMTGQELKRDPENAQDAVRVATVHGAKGLEAPIVFIADAGPHGAPRRGCLLWSTGHGEGRGELPFWRAAKAAREPWTAGLAEIDERRECEERRRLLYVALTRARDRLYLAGWEGKRTNGEEPCWHELVRRALDAADGVERVKARLRAGWEGETLRHCCGVPAAGEPMARPKPLPAAPLPGWARSDAPSETGSLRPLAPSRLDADEPAPISPAGADGAKRFRIGLLVHKLFQLVPSLPEGKRVGAVERFLATAAGDLPAEVRSRVRDQVLAVLGEPDLAPVFAEGARAEQAIAGVVGGIAVAGQIDRLAVTAEAVIFVDFKTNRMPPPAPERTPLAYLRQMAAYRALLRRLWPDRDIKAALVWTETCSVTWLPGDLLDPHLSFVGEPSSVGVA
jgi:ATP-dependent helicase/nuclease subunit A